LHALAPQTYAPQDFADGLHVPAPSQVLTLVSVPSEQLGVPHDVSAVG
jgi:hypothetical protein